MTPSRRSRGPTGSVSEDTHGCSQGALPGDWTQEGPVPRHHCAPARAMVSVGSLYGSAPATSRDWLASDGVDQPPRDTPMRPAHRVTPLLLATATVLGVAACGDQSGTPP